MTLIASAPPRLEPLPVVLPRSRAWIVPSLVAAFTVLALALRLYRLLFGYAHAVGDYDGGVYLGSSLSLVDGRLPYRDYVFVQPPGIALLLAPVALLAKVVGTAQAMGLAKVLTALAGAASVPVTALIVRHRGAAPVVIACGLMALQTDAVSSAYTPLLEPWLVLFGLVAIALAFDGDELAGTRRLGWAGLVLGFACAIKIWALAPVAVLALLVLRRRRGARAHLGGLLAGFAVPALPFALAAPGAFWHQVFTDQLLRSAAARTTTSFRLVHMFASAPADADSTSTGWTALVALACVVMVALAFGWLRRRPASPLEWFAVSAAVLVVAMMLTPDTFYWHYAAFTAPFLVLVAVLRLPRSAGGAWRRVGVALLAACVLALAGVTVHRDARSYSQQDNHRALDALVPASACLVTSSASVAIAADRFRPGARDCPLMLDAFATILAATGGHAPSSAAVRSPAVERVWLRLYEQADFVYLKPRDSALYPTSGAAQRYLDAHFHGAPLAGGGTLYQRIAPAPR